MGKLYLINVQVAKQDKSTIATAAPSGGMTNTANRTSGVPATTVAGRVQTGGGSSVPNTTPSGAAQTTTAGGATVSITTPLTPATVVGRLGPTIAAAPAQPTAGVAPARPREVHYEYQRGRLI